MGRRHHQVSGHVYKRGPSWYLQYRVDTPDLDEKGNFKRKLLTRYLAPASGDGKVGKREAEKIAKEEYMDKLTPRSTRPQSMLTVREFIVQRFEPDLFWAMKPAGRSHYENMFKNHILPLIGAVRLRDVTPAHVQGLIKKEIERGNSVSTAKHVRIALGAVLKHAKGMGWLSGDIVTENVKLPKHEPAQRGALTVQQVVEIVNQLPEVVLPKKTLGEKRNAYARDLLEQYETLVLLLAWTGLRSGEAMALRWSHLNASDTPKVLPDGFSIPNGFLYVESNYSRVPKRFMTAGDRYGTPKSKKSRRIVPVPAWLQLRLLSLKGREKFTDPEHPIFASNSGRPLNANNIEKRVFKPAAVLAKMEYATIHWLRHTSRTLLDGAGASSAEAMKILGHAAEGISLHYTHPEVQSLRNRMDQLEDPTKKLHIVDRRKAS